jgi:hypothetical protein
MSEESQSLKHKLGNNRPPAAKLASRLIYSSCGVLVRGSPTMCAWLEALTRCTPAVVVDTCPSVGCGSLQQCVLTPAAAVRLLPKAGVKVQASALRLRPAARPELGWGRPWWQEPALLGGSLDTAHGSSKGWLIVVCSANPQQCLAGCQKSRGHNSPCNVCWHVPQ